MANSHKQKGKRVINDYPQIKTDFYNPYTFVPLCNSIFYLSEEESKKLNYAHVVPFNNALTGSIVVDFETVTPLCVKTGGRKENVKVDNYFVPASSLKGMIRNVFEIIACCNIRKRIANNRYSMRDLYSSNYELKANVKPQKSGFLIQMNNEFYILPCESQQLTYDEIEEIEKVKGLKYKRNIKEKYELIPEYVSEYDDGVWRMWFFSGFMNNKKNEYLFDIPTTFSVNDFLPIGENVYKDFVFIHQKENENLNWKFWKNKLKNYNSIEEIQDDHYSGIVPCFFRQINNVVLDFGLSFLYRQPYKKTIHDCLPKQFQNENIDIADAVFGFTSLDLSLKGRVQFTNSFIQGAKLDSEQTFILGSPKPTYYPFYLKQEKGRLQNYFDSGIQITGWKRYLLRKKAVFGSGGIKPKAESTFTPLQTGTSFKTKICFFNLQPYELGALLSALTFNNNQETCYHSLGYAKPYGYGKIKVKSYEINYMSYVSKRWSTTDLMEKFQNKLLEITKMKKAEYEEYLSKFLLIASGHYENDKPIRYPDLNSKEFESIKKKKLNINDFSPKIATYNP